MNLYLRDIHFIRRPPICMPLRVEGCEMHGYWFDPIARNQEDVPVDLVVESAPNMVSALRDM